MTHAGNKGFSLVQVSIILVVASMIMVSVLPGGKAGSDADKIKITRERMQAIETATQAFMTKNLRRPCPAAFSAAQGSALFGVEMGHTDATTVGTLCDDGGSAAEDFFSDGNVLTAIGSVPTKTLGLADEYALDGFGRRIDYVVDKRAVASLSCRGMQNRGGKGSLEISEGFAIEDTSEKVMWALLSHGKDGHGAVPANGSTVDTRINTYTTDQASQFNAFSPDGSGDTSSRFGKDFGSGVLGGARLIRKAPTATFDDIVWTQESTKNTCCVGAACNTGFRVLGPETASNSNGARFASGDFNGDGIADLAIGYYVQQKVYLIFGSKTDWPIAPDAMDLAVASSPYLDGTKGLMFTSAGDGDADSFGWNIALGDISGDGKADLIIGAETNFTAIFGTATPNSITNLATVNGNRSLEVTTGITTANGIRFQHANTSFNPGPIAIGDLNGDGYNDLALTRDDTIASYPNDSLLYIVYGRSNANWATYGATMNLTSVAAQTIDLSVASKPNFFTITGANILSGSSANANYGSTDFGKTAGVGNTVSIGNMNGDTYKDLLLAGKFATARNTVSGTTTYGNMGTVFLLFGRATASWPTSGSPPTLSVRTALDAGVSNAVRIHSPTQAANQYFGDGVSVGDTNNDGIDDIIVLNPRTGSTAYTRLILGKSSAFTSPYSTVQYTLTNSLETSPALCATPALAAALTPFNVPKTVLADMNSDGLLDIVLGARGMNPYNSSNTQIGANTGTTYIIFQPAAGFTGTKTLFGSNSATALFSCDSYLRTLHSSLAVAPYPAVRIDATGASRFFGTSLPAAGDWNGDGKTDLIIDMPGYLYDTGKYGVSFVLYGKGPNSWTASNYTTDYIAE